MRQIIEFSPSSFRLTRHLKGAASEKVKTCKQLDLLEKKTGWIEGARKWLTVLPGTCRVEAFSRRSRDSSQTLMCLHRGKAIFLNCRSPRLLFHRTTGECEKEKVHQKINFSPSSPTKTEELTDGSDENHSAAPPGERTHCPSDYWASMSGYFRPN